MNSMVALAFLAPDPVTSLMLGLAILLMAAKIGGHAAVRLGQPAVLGELVVGIVLGNLALVGVPGLAQITHDPMVDMIARLGVIILLFEVGLESTVGEMLRVGRTALSVAALGVLAPFALGWGVGALLLPDSGPYVHAFLGATLCATSVGITARVFQDLGHSKSAEARVILGAAVIDDVLGLVILAVVTGMITRADVSGGFSAVAVLAVLAKAIVFLVGSLVLGVLLSPRIFSTASRIRARGVLLATGLSFCFLLSWAAGAVGLAPIVGAFAAGLILEDVHYRGFVARDERALGELVRPLVDFLAPVFFVLMGMRTDLRVFAEPSVLGLAAALVVAAVIGKQACALGVFQAGVDRWSVGLGMIPRGEVGLIFANIGLSLSIGGRPIMDAATFSAVVVMVLVTTLVTPPALKWSLARRAASRP
ncbi:MAG: cation:proton antiporter [Acidobacteria bacterium]|jgi:Kef-type K+ transport system membrane component KefB|nr:cation:proton antiporter [Acidobacteriota bacterium]